MNPLLAIAGRLRLEGHTVVFVGHATAEARRLITGAGFRFVDVRPSLSSLGFLFLPFMSGYIETLAAVNLFAGGVFHYARTIGHVLDEVRPDAVIADFAIPGACLAAEKSNVPYITVYQAGLAFKGPGIPPFGSGLAINGQWGKRGRVYVLLSDYLESSVDKALSRARRRLRLPPGKRAYLTSPSSPWLNLALTAECIEAPRYKLPPTTFFVGPCLASGRDTGADNFPFEQLSREKPRIYVSLGTVFNNRPKIFTKIIDGFRDGRHQLIISAGNAFDRLSSRDFPTDVLLFKNVPQSELLSRVDVVISHGGNNTVNESLSAGKPLLVLPVGGEQADNASRVEYIRAGLRGDLNKSTSQEIRYKVERLLQEPEFQLRAREVSGELASTQGPVTASRFIGRVAQTRRPLLRPEGYPLTVTRHTPPPWEFGGG